jgi:NitT/TauT family transport system substrate-binding protein
MSSAEEEQEMRLHAKWILALVMLASALFSCSGRLEPVTVAYAPFESTALLWIAQDQGFLTRNGLDLTLREYDSGVAALDGMVNGEADLAVGANEFPLVGRAFQKAAIRTIGSIARSEFIYLVGRKDRGIQQVSDLKGKRVGTTFRTIAEFHLGRFLELHGMNLEDVILVDLRTPEEWVGAVANGDIDAIATAQPYANQASDRLGEIAVVWPVQSHQPLYTQVIAPGEWIAGHPELVSKFLRSLLQAEEYAIRYPAGAKAIVQESLGLDSAYIETVWSQNQFSLSLDQSLVLAMEDEARWMIANGLTTETELPDFLDYVYADGMDAVKPDAVNIIR